MCEGVELAEGERINASVVLSAVPCFQFVELLPGGLLRSEAFFERILALRPAPIISVNLWLDRPVTEHDFAGLRGTTAQWLFNKGRLLRDGARPSTDALLPGLLPHGARPSVCGGAAVRERGGGGAGLDQ